MKIDLTCPAEILRCRLSDNSGSGAEVTLNNLAGKKVVSCEVTLVLHGREEEDTTRVVYRCHDLKAAPGTPFSFDVPFPDQSLVPARIEVIIEKIWYDDASVWRRGRTPMTEYRPNTLPRGRELEKLRFVAGPEAVGYPEVQDHVWLCVCGRPNAPAQETCVHCGLDREEVFRLYNRDAVEQKVADHEARLNQRSLEAREDSSRRQVVREAVYEQKKAHRRRIRNTVLSLLAAGALLACAYFFLLPYLRYRGALGMLQNGEYARAAQVFEEMGDYMESPERLQRCRYEMAKELQTTGTEESLLEAREMFLNLGTYLDSATEVKHSDYLRGMLLISDGRPSEASEIFESLGSYLDSPDQVVYCAYLKAVEMQASNDLVSAAEIFESLGNYLDSSDQALACRLDAARAALSSGDPDVALEVLSPVLDRPGTDTLIRQAHYQRGKQLYAQGQMTEAGNEFLLAGNYEDAQDQARLCIYTPAVQAMERGEYLSASDMFASIPGYLDADERSLECIYLQAGIFLKDQEYTRAQELYRSLPETYKDTTAMIRECIWRPAIEAMDRGDFARCQELLLSLGEDEAAEKQLKKCRYAWANALTGEGRLEEAAALYEQLGNYQRAPALLRQLRYRMAENAVTAGDYDLAILLYSDLGNYMQSRARLKNARYQKAVRLYEQNSFQEALEIFESLENYEDSRKQVLACRYAMALETEAREDWESAITAFEALEDYEDSAQHLSACRYALAKRMLSEGMPLEAAAALDELGDYEDAAELARQARYEYALTLADEGRHREAAELFAALGDFQNSQQKTLEEYYLQAEASIAEGKQEDAIAFYELAGDYADAREKLASFTDMVYTDPAEAARTACADEQWAYAAYVLSGLDLSHLPETFADLPELYVSACYHQGMLLWEADQPDAAYPYLQRAADQPGVSRILESSSLWKLLGTWTDDQHTLTFSGDGTCEIDGESAAWELQEYSILINGEERYKISSSIRTTVALRDTAEGKTLTLSRTAPAPLLPLPAVEYVEPAPAATEAPAEAETVPDAQAETEAGETESAPADDASASAPETTPAPEAEAAPAETAPAAEETAAPANP